MSNGVVKCLCLLLHLDSVPGVVALLALGHHVNVLAEEVHQLPLPIWPSGGLKLPLWP